jgi:hypothetical protein
VVEHQPQHRKKKKKDLSSNYIGEGKASRVPLGKVPGDSLPSVNLALQKAEIRRIEVQDPISKIPNIGLASRVTCLARLQTPELKKKKRKL